MTFTWPEEQPPPPNLTREQLKSDFRQMVTRLRDKVQTPAGTLPDVKLAGQFDILDELFRSLLTSGSNADNLGLLSITAALRAQDQCRQTYKALGLAEEVKKPARPK